MTHKKDFTMLAHLTGSGKKERRSKGRNKKPEFYLLVEILLLALVVFHISFAKIKFLTVLSALAAIFFVIQSCYPRYKRIIARQTDRKVFNNTHH